MRQLLRSLVLVCAAVALAGCSSLSMPTAAKLRAVDYLNDDIASLLIAFDLPVGIEPIADGSTMSFTVTSGTGGGARVIAVLTRAADADAASGLPPPGGDRIYYLFGFSDADKAALRAAQATARALPPGNNSIIVDMGPRFCARVPTDLAKVRFSVLIALPGSTGLEPLINGESLQAVLAPSGQTALPPCARRS